MGGIIKVNLTGQRFERLLVLSESERISKYVRRWKCKCDCGNVVIVSHGHLQTGDTKSCGCLSAQRIGDINRTHGDSHKAREYYIWKNMRARCKNVNNERYKDYGGRGIRVCDRWSDYSNFLFDMGRSPSKEYSVDRINNDGNYEPSNCRWATKQEQANNCRSNRLITYKNETKTLTEWSRISGIPFKTIFKRLSYGWSSDRTFTEQGKLKIIIKQH